VILAGPTRDSADILYRGHPYELLLGLAIGDTVDFLSVSAHTAIASVAFNGVPPFQTDFFGTAEWAPNKIDLRQGKTSPVR
jgi:diaminopimelate decarboxylase